jgi:pilus assembly protein Flp/PilA
VPGESQLPFRVCAFTDVRREACVARPCAVEAVRHAVRSFGSDRRGYKTGGHSGCCHRTNGASAADPEKRPRRYGSDDLNHPAGTRPLCPPPNTGPATPGLSGISGASPFPTTAVAQRLRLEDRRAVVHCCWPLGHITTMRAVARGEEVMNLTKHVNAFVRDEEGQDLIEYALLVALISLVCVVALTDAGTEVNKIFVAIKGKLASAGAGS